MAAETAAAAAAAADADLADAAESGDEPGPLPPASPPRERPAKDAKWELSDWGLFYRTETRVQRERGTYRRLTYAVAGKEVTFLKPIDGEGTNLMHGDFARKLSPSEEALTTWILKHLRSFANKRVLVLGAGLGLAGMAVAACSEAKCVDMTDGDPEVVGTLRASLELNEGSFGSTKLSVQQLYWKETGKSLDDPYDIIIAADVVYLEEFHSALLGTAGRSIKQGGLFVMIASKRNGSLDKFITLARNSFPRTIVSDDYDADVSKAIRRSAKCFPIMLRMLVPQAEKLPERVIKMCEDSKQKLLERKKEEERITRRENVRREQFQELNGKMAALRGVRLEAETEAAAAYAEEAAAEAAAPRRALPSKCRQRPQHPELEGRSDWGLFGRKCRTSEDGTEKEMTFDCGGTDVVIKKPLLGRWELSAAEEALATYIMKHKKVFKKKRILVLGAGLGLASFVAGVLTAAKHLEVTDGEEQVVALLRENLELNVEAMQAKKVVVKRLMWGDGLDVGTKPFDLVIGAEVMQSEDTDGALLRTMRRVLKPSGLALLFASPRAGSLDAFSMAACSVFDRVETTRDWDKDAEKAFRGFKCFPRMIRLQWSNNKAPAPAVKSTRRSSSQAAVLGSTAEAAAEAPSEAPSEENGGAKWLAAAVAAAAASKAAEAAAATAAASPSPPPRLPSPAVAPPSPAPSPRSVAASSVASSSASVAAPLRKQVRTTSLPLLSAPPRQAPRAASVAVDEAAAGEATVFGGAVGSGAAVHGGYPQAWAAHAAPYIMLCRQSLVQSDEATTSSLSAGPRGRCLRPLGGKTDSRNDLSAVVPDPRYQLPSSAGLPGGRPLKRRSQSLGVGAEGGPIARGSLDFGLEMVGRGVIGGSRGRSSSARPPSAEFPAPAGPPQGLFSKQVTPGSLWDRSDQGPRSLSSVRCSASMLAGGGGSIAACRRGSMGGSGLPPMLPTASLGRCY